MSFYPKKETCCGSNSIKAVAHTIKSHQNTLLIIPPVAISIHSKSIGMEYPMICFNGGRPDKDGTSL